MHDNLLHWTLELDHLQLVLEKQAQELQRISKILGLLADFLRESYPQDIYLPEGK